jgi:hypothetical protein
MVDAGERLVDMADLQELLASFTLS